MVDNVLDYFVVHSRKDHNFKERLNSTKEFISVRSDLVDHCVTEAIRSVRAANWSWSSTLGVSFFALVLVLFDNDVV